MPWLILLLGSDSSEPGTAPFRGGAASPDQAQAPNSAASSQMGSSQRKACKVRSRLEVHGSREGSHKLGSYGHN